MPNATLENGLIHYNPNAQLRKRTQCSRTQKPMGGRNLIQHSIAERHKKQKVHYRRVKPNPNQTKLKKARINKLKGDKIPGK